MDNAHNKSKLIHLLSVRFYKHQIILVQWDNNADTLITEIALTDVKDNSVEVISLSQLCVAYHFTGMGRRSRFADIVGVPLLIYFFQHIKGCLRCEDNPRSALLKTEALLAILSCFHWL